LEFFEKHKKEILDLKNQIDETDKWFLIYMD